MTQGDRSAVDVDLRAIEVEIAHEFLRDDGKGLVDLPQVDIVDSQPGALQYLARGGDGGVEHQGRIFPDIGGGDDPRTRLQTVLFGIVARGDEHRGGTVGHPHELPA